MTPDIYTMPCPYCGARCDNAEFVHNGLGMQQVTPFGCEQCGAYEASPYERLDSMRERYFQCWHAPQWGGRWLWVRTWAQTLYRRLAVELSIACWHFRDWRARQPKPRQLLRRLWVSPTPETG